MNYNDFKQAVIDCAKAQGVTEYDLYYTSGSATSVTAYEKDIENFSDTTTLGVCFRCIVDGKMGYSNTQKLCKEEAERLVRDAKAGAAVIESSDAPQIFAGSEKYASIPQSTDTGCDVEQLKSFALDIEAKALASDKRIESVSRALARHGIHEVRLYNSKGLDLHNRQSGYAIACGVTATDGERKYADWASQQRIEIDEIDVDELVKDGVDKVIGAIGGSTVPSGQYPVIISKQMMTWLLDCFSSIFSADMAQKGMSLLANKENETIASDIVTIIDDPHFAESSEKSPFDDEGVATRVKTLVENGVLKTLLYDLKSAQKAGVQSTGNGRKMSYASDITVAPYTLYIKPHDGDVEQLMQKAGKAIYVTKINGLHAGANAVTGDFSLESKGFLVENGKISRPAEQFTIAGNFMQMLRDITALAGDFVHEDGFGSPSALISALSVAGEN